MIFRRLPPLALVVALAAAGCAHPPATQTAATKPAPAHGTAITAGDLRQRLFIYSDDSMQGRETGKIGDYRATAYIAAEAKRMGLEPAGDGGTYFQTIPLHWLTLDLAASRVSVGGTALALGTDIKILPPVDGIPVPTKVTLDGAATVYGGRFDDPLLLGAERAAGKVVVVGVPPGTGEHFTQERILRDLQQFATASAIVFTNLSEPPDIIGTILDQQPAVVGDTVPTSPRQLPPILFATTGAAERILGAPATAWKTGASGPPLTLVYSYRLKEPEAAARNVVAILPGSDPALRGEYVAFGAHNDHLGLAKQAVDHDSIWVLNHVLRPHGADTPLAPPTAEQAARMRVMLDSLRRVRPPRRDSVYNGADDDGSGTVSELEVAQSFAAAHDRPKRSLLFVWHTGEEEGLWGSDWYTRHTTVPRDSIIAQLNMDMIGRGDAVDLTGGGPAYLQLIGSRRLSTELGNIVEAVNAREPHPFAFDYAYDANGDPNQFYCRSDHAMYARFGIPIVFFTAGDHPDYHQLTDEAGAIDYDKMARVDQLVHDVGDTIANMPHRVVVDHPKPDPDAPCRQ
jgi:Peptidase family M28